MWSSGNAYEQFMGRWSTLVTQKFLQWLDIPSDSRWGDVGCGTGTLSRVILDSHQPQEVIALDPSSEFVAYAQNAIPDHRIQVRVGLAQALDLPTDSMDAMVSGLVLNFVPQPDTALHEMRRVTRPGGKVGIFLWDYAEGMEMLRYYWDAATALDEKAIPLDEGVRFSLCREGALEKLAQEIGFKQVEAAPIEVQTEFQNFDDFWQPFLGNVGPAPAYCMGLQAEDRQRLENRLRGSLPIQADGSIPLRARAWAIKGLV
ncbi:MAG: class I SAM-dependent methyltransferase [Anaerolineales bacterium]|nr:class I SAM-dependent methyltransferase [Anaerolineales bacterium]